MRTDEMCIVALNTGMQMVKRLVLTTWLLLSTPFVAQAGHLGHTERVVGLHDGGKGKW